LTLPVPVILKRFLAPDLVLILGIWLSCRGRSKARQRRAVPAVLERERCSD